MAFTLFRRRSLLLLGCAAALALPGCDHEEERYEGYAVWIGSERLEGTYAEVWSNEYPESAGYPGFGKVLSSSDGDYYGVLPHCVNPTPDGYYLKVVLREHTDGPFGPEPGQAIVAKRWDGLECHEPYTAVIGPNLELDLYHCRCWEDGKREGKTPLTGSGG